MSKEDAARKTLVDRYIWEMKAIAQDVSNKVDMGILEGEAAVNEYVSDLLKSHPRTQHPEKAAESLMCSHYREVGHSHETRLEKADGDWGALREDAYYAMGEDIFKNMQGPPRPSEG